MPNIDNLKPRDLSTEEATEMGRKGGIASGEARRKKKSWAQQIELLMNLPVKQGKTKEALTQLGIEETEQNNLMAMNVAMYQQALKGNVSAFNSLRLQSTRVTADVIKQSTLFFLKTYIQNITMGPKKL